MLVCDTYRPGEGARSRLGGRSRHAYREIFTPTHRYRKSKENFIYQASRSRQCYERAFLFVSGGFQRTTEPRRV